MRVMAIDYGDVRTGIAISDLTGLLAGYAVTVQATSPQKLAAQICTLCREHDVGELVLGYPKNMDGSLGARAEKSETLAELLRRETGLPVTLWDERRTTTDAHRILHANGKREKKHKKTVDAVAAALILEGYLQYRRINP